MPRITYEPTNPAYRTGRRLSRATSNPTLLIAGAPILGEPIGSNTWTRSELTRSAVGLAQSDLARTIDEWFIPALAQKFLEDRRTDLPARGSSGGTPGPQGVAKVIVGAATTAQDSIKDEDSPAGPPLKHSETTIRLRTR